MATTTPDGPVFPVRCERKPVLLLVDIPVNRELERGPVDERLGQLQPLLAAASAVSQALADDKVQSFNEQVARMPALVRAAEKDFAAPHPLSELVKAVSAEEPPPTSFPVGEPLQTEVWRSELRDNDFLSPAGAIVAVKRELTGERVSVTFTPDELGFYTLGKPRVLRAFGINAMEIDTAVRHGAKVVFIVSNNAAWNIERLDQEMNYGGRVVGTTLRHSDYAGLARSLGAHGERVEKPSELEGALRRALKNAPALVDVVTSQSVLSTDAQKGLGFVPDFQALTAWDDAERKRREPR